MNFSNRHTARVALTALPALMMALVSPAHALPIFGVAGGNVLVRFDTTTPGTVSTVGTITNLGAQESILGIDFRPADGKLYGLGSGSNLYTIDTMTGAALQVGASGGFTTSGGTFGFDFNPVVDRLRITSDQDQNLRVNPNTGALVLADTPLAYDAADVNAGADPNVMGSGYTNSFQGTLATKLYGIDSALDILVLQDPANSGALKTVGGGLGVDASLLGGFDISSFTGVGYASFADALGSGSDLYSIDITSGAATLIGGINVAGQVNSIALAPVPEPGTMALLGLGVASLLAFRRKKA